MDQMSKFQRSWILFKSSVLIISRNKKLLIFPVLTLALTGVILLFFLAPVALQKTGHGYTHLEHWKAVGQTIFFESSSANQGGASGSFHLKPLGMAYGAIVYFLSMFLATFFNVAFYHQILGALKGNPTSIGGGLAFARSRWQSILMWTLFAGVVGLIIRSLEQKLDFFGQIILGWIGTAWSVASVFVIPVIITEQTSINPLHMLKTSALTLKKTWGESLIGYLGLQFGGLLVLIGSLLCLAGAIAASIALDNFWILAGTGLVWLISMTAFAYLTSVAGQVYRCALFVYASEGTIAEPYNLELLQMAWKVKKNS
jgi:hypothetical protein